MRDLMNEANEIALPDPTLSTDHIGAGCVIAADAFGDVRRDLANAEAGGEAALARQLPLARVRLTIARDLLEDLLRDCETLETLVRDRLDAARSPKAVQ